MRFARIIHWSALIDLLDWKNYEPSSQSDTPDLARCRDSHPGHAEAIELYCGDLPDRDRLNRPVGHWIHATIARLAEFRARQVNRQLVPGKFVSKVIDDSNILGENLFATESLSSVKEPRR